MFISPALAQDTGAPGGSNIILQLMPFILIFAIMYFLIIRPQQKRLKAHREMVANVKRGDTVVTAGGLIGKVVSVVDDDEIRVDIADGVRVSVVRSTLSDVRPKGEVRGAKSASQSESKAEEIEHESDEVEEQEAPAPEKTTASNGASRKQPARKSRAASSGGTRKSSASAASKAGAAKTGASRSRRSTRSKSGNGAPADGAKDTGDNA